MRRMERACWRQACRTGPTARGLAGRQPGAPAARCRHSGGVPARLGGPFSNPAQSAGCRYHLAGLQRGKGYEVRVSFPGTVRPPAQVLPSAAALVTPSALLSNCSLLSSAFPPALVRLQAAVRVRLWLDSAAAADGSGSGGGLTHRSHVHSRKLLDAEKVMFGTDAEGRVWLPEQRKAVRHCRSLPRTQRRRPGPCPRPALPTACPAAPLPQLSAAAVLFKAEAWGRWRQPGQAPQLLLYDIGDRGGERRINCVLAGTSPPRPCWVQQAPPPPPPDACCRQIRPYFPLPAVLEQSTLGVPHSALPLLATAALLVLLAAAAAPWWSGSVVPAILRWLHGERSAGSGREEAPQAAAAAATRPRPRRAPSVR